MCLMQNACDFEGLMKNKFVLYIRNLSFVLKCVYTQMHFNANEGLLIYNKLLII